MPDRTHLCRSSAARRTHASASRCRARWSAPRCRAAWQSPLHSCVARSEEHTSELQSLMRISYAVFCLKKKTHNIPNKQNRTLRYEQNTNSINIQLQYTTKEQ